MTSILCSQSSEHSSFLRSTINIPLIVSSSTMTVLNSMSEGNDNSMKYNKNEQTASTSPNSIIGWKLQINGTGNQPYQEDSGVHVEQVQPMRRTAASWHAIR